jgi:hypothetical protein
MTRFLKALVPVLERQCYSKYHRETNQAGDEQLEQNNRLFHEAKKADMALRVFDAGHAREGNLSCGIDRTRKRP